MFTWIKKRVLEKAEQSQRKEADDWNRRLSLLDGRDVAAILVMTQHWKNYLREEFIWELDFPHTVALHEPLAAFRLVKLIQTFQSKGETSVASGLFPWVFTLRAVTNVGLLDTAREVWSNLRRGDPYFDEARENLAMLDLSGLRLYGDLRTPDGFEPRSD
jgi:hypothetical protein